MSSSATGRRPHAAGRGGQDDKRRRAVFADHQCSHALTVTVYRWYQDR
jgi:hypothetical protein